MSSSSSSSSPYSPAAQILNQIWTKRKGLKTIVYTAKGELTCSKTTYAQCSNVLAHKPVLEQLIEELGLEAKNMGLLFVLLYEVLLGPNQSIRGGGSLKRLIMKHETQLRHKLDELQPESTQKAIKTTTVPRYVRINTLQTSTETVLQEIKDQKVYMDPHVPDLLVMEPTAETRTLLQPMVTSHQVVLQDKSSCFSALSLLHGFEDAGRHGNYLDACAAPGNKTSHLAALLAQQQANKKCTIFALDQSKDRFQLLQRRMQELTTNGSSSTSTTVQCQNADFLKMTPSELPNLVGILLDPSCSGSGMISNHNEHSTSRDPNFCNNRITSLAKFQQRALMHALTKFPSAQRVVYSTCSLYTEENESVVQLVLSNGAEDWELVAPKCLRDWKRRGIPTKDGLTSAQANCLIRVDPFKDATNGFFVACFQRKTKNNNCSTTKKTTDAKKSLKSFKEIEFYTDQFDQTSTTTKKIQPLSKESNAPTSPKDTFSNQKKRKAPPPNSDNEKKDSDTTMNRKRAKKLEWRRKQREKKSKRLETQEKQKKGTNESSH